VLLSNFMAIFLQGALTKAGIATLLDFGVRRAGARGDGRKKGRKGDADCVLRFGDRRWDRQFR